MTGKESARLTEWLLNQGFTEEDVIDCINCMNGKRKVGKRKNTEPEKENNQDSGDKES